jgi:predicted ArsR family transcriptional regulator
LFLDQTADNRLHWSWAAVLTDPIRLSVLRALCELRPATALDLCRRCHSSDPTVRRHLTALEAIGLVRGQPGERDGLTAGRPAKRYTIDSDAAGRLEALFELLSQPLLPSPAPR